MVSVKPTYDPNRWMAVCDRCQWSTASTGPKAEGRVRKRAAEHQCPGYPHSSHFGTDEESTRRRGV